MRERLDEAFFEEATDRRPEGRPWVLPLAPVLILWLSAWMIQEVRAGFLASAEPGLRPLAGAGVRRAKTGLSLRDGPARRIRTALALLARDEPAKARALLLAARAELGDEPFLLRALARAERALGHREEAADLYVQLLQNRADDRDALEFFLAYRYEEDDLAGALAVADELDARGELTGEAALLAQRIRAESVDRALARRAVAAAPLP